MHSSLDQPTPADDLTKTQTGVKSKKNAQADFLVDLEQWGERFEAMSVGYLLGEGLPEIQGKIREMIPNMMSLLKQEMVKSSSIPLD